MLLEARTVLIDLVIADLCHQIQLQCTQDWLTVTLCSASVDLGYAGHMRSTLMRLPQHVTANHKRPISCWHTSDKGMVLSQGCQVHCASPACWAARLKGLQGQH